MESRPQVDDPYMVNQGLIGPFAPFSSLPAAALPAAGPSSLCIGYRVPGTSIGIGTISWNLARVSIGGACATLELPLPRAFAAAGDNIMGRTTPHSQFWQLSLGDLVVRSLTSRPLC